jgi:Chaperone of endosialidase
VADPREIDSNDDPAGDDAKKAYTPPTLTCFGSVRSFTKSGTSGPNEQSGMTTSKMLTSDRALKENIVRVGDHPLGIGLYLFDYLPQYRAAWGQGRQFGVRADEVEAVMPEAVSTHPDGYRRVDYGLLGVRHSPN